jgi:aerobic C4-dicarboxylate transport protein
LRFFSFHLRVSCDALAVYSGPMTPVATRKPLYQNLTVQVLTAIIIGAAIGAIRPQWGMKLKPVMDGFINLIKMVVGPIIFLTIVVGIASMGDLKKVGRVGLKALLYFELVTTLALGIGLVVANVLGPGHGVDTGHAQVTAEIASYQNKASQQSISEFVLHIIPDNVAGAFAKGDLLQILCFSVLFGLAVASLGERGAPVVRGLEHLTEVMFRLVALIMYVAPLGALGAMAFTIGTFGLKTLLPLMKLMGCVYLTMGLFIFGGLGVICWLFGFSLWRYLVFIREEILLVLGTSSSESALPRMIEKLELLGCKREIVGLVIPAGYSFNLDGTSIYLSMAVLFIAQAFGVHMGLGQQLYVMAILMLTSKGAAAVTGSGFITLAATVTATGVLPIAGLGLLFGVDRFMSEARAITNLIGNGVATMCVSKWEGSFDVAQYRRAISGQAMVGLASSIGEVPVEISADVAR